MPIPVTVPRLGWNMEEGTFVEWVAADGAAVKPGDVLFRLEGDKAVEEVESLDAGTLRLSATGPQPGDRVKVGDVIAELVAEAVEVAGTSPQVVPPHPACFAATLSPGGEGVKPTVLSRRPLRRSRRRRPVAFHPLPSGERVAAKHAG